METGPVLIFAHGPYKFTLDDEGLRVKHNGTDRWVGNRKTVDARDFRAFCVGYMTAVQIIEKGSDIG